MLIDLIVGAVIVAAAIYGWGAGLGRALPVAGFAAGAVLGSRLPVLVGTKLESSSALLIALPAALVVGGIVGALAERLAPSAERLVRRLGPVDGLAGALLVGASAAVAAWALAPAVSQGRVIRDGVRRSEVLARFDAVLTPAGPSPGSQSRASDLPQSAERRPRAPVRAPGLRSIPAVKRADRSLVKIVITRCNGAYQGSGWIAGHGVVVTNAHVVTTAKKVVVTREGKGASLPATVIWFDGIHDLALLRVPRLGAAPGLPLVDDPRPQTRGFSLGFPSGSEAVRRARLQRTTTQLKLPTEKLENNAGVSLTMKERLVAVFRGVNGPGGSGGPIIDRRGRVLATVFAGIPRKFVFEGITNGVTLAVPNRIVRSAIRRARGRVRVPACGAPPLQPTAKESIAARNA